ncbi:MAG: AbrB family transcriptional regulator [Clostridia bacterium]|nr:AbrB family transcriptional regulator [Clostridia bacterium]
MKAAGVVRKVDNLGRFVLPPDLCAALGIVRGKDSFEVFLENDSIVLKKYNPGCVFCGSIENLSSFKNVRICDDCRRKIAESSDVKKNQ